MCEYCSQPTYHLVQGWHGVRGTFSVVSVLWLIKMAALVIHAAALELAKEVEEAVFIGGVTAQLLQEKRQVCKTQTDSTAFLLKFCHLFIYFYWNQDFLTSLGDQMLIMWILLEKFCPVSKLVSIPELKHFEFTTMLKLLDYLIMLNCS